MCGFQIFSEGQGFDVREEDLFGGSAGEGGGGGEEEEEGKEIGGEVHMEC